MTKFPRLDEVCNQAATAAVCGLTEAAVSHLVADAVFDLTDTLQERIAKIVRHRGELAARRGAQPNSQRDRVLRAQAEKLERENAVREGQLIPAEQLTRALSDVAGQAIPILEALPGRIRMANPDTSVAVLKTVEVEIVKLRNLWADIQLGGGDR